MKPYRFHREADAEFTDALNYYSDRGAELGVRFYDEIEQVIAEVCAHPVRFRQIDPPVRRHLVPSFPYALLYIGQRILELLVAIAGPSYLKITERWLPYLERGAAVSFARAQTLTIATEHNRHSFGAAPDFRWLSTPKP